MPQPKRKRRNSCKRNAERDEVITTMMGYAKAVAVNHPLARLIGVQDAIADAYVALCIAYDSYNPAGGASLKTWVANNIRWHLMNVVLTRKIMMRRGTDNKTAVPVPEMLSLTGLAKDEEHRDQRYDVPDDRALAEFSHMENLLSFISCLELLNIKTKAVLMRYYIDGVSQTVLAEEMGITKQAVSQRIQSGLKKIRRSI